MSNFSTIAQLKINIPFVSGVISSTALTNNIVDADKEIKDDLSKYLEWADITALAYVPRVLNRLSQYKSCELTIARKWLDDTSTIGLDSDDTQTHGFVYWTRKYNMLLKQIKSGDIMILDNNEDELTEDYGKGSGGVGRII